MVESGWIDNVLDSSRELSGALRPRLGLALGYAAVATFTFVMTGVLPAAYVLSSILVKHDAGHTIGNLSNPHTTSGCPVALGCITPVPPSSAGISWPTHGHLALAAGYGPGSERLMPLAWSALDFRCRPRFFCLKGSALCHYWPIPPLRYARIELRRLFFGAGINRWTSADAVAVVILLCAVLL